VVGRQVVVVQHANPVPVDFLRMWRMSTPGLFNDKTLEVMTAAIQTSPINQ
jgi:hypothetical protein